MLKKAKNKKSLVRLEIVLPLRTSLFGSQHLSCFIEEKKNLKIACPIRTYLTSPYASPPLSFLPLSVQSLYSHLFILPTYIIYSPTKP